MIETPKEEAGTVVWETAEKIQLPEIDRSLRLDIREYPIMKQTLRTVCSNISEIEASNPEMREFIAAMVSTLYDANKPGVGLAANQVGINARIIVVDSQWVDTENPEPKVLINPIITYSEGLQESKEGCLSIPLGYTGVIERDDKINVQALTLNWEPIEFETEGFESAVIQHEIDHLDGILFIDHLSRIKRDMYNRKIKKIMRFQKKSYKEMVKKRRIKYDGTGSSSSK